jgi:hypothetical protein
LTLAELLVAAAVEADAPEPEALELERAAPELVDPEPFDAEVALEPSPVAPVVWKMGDAPEAGTIVVSEPEARTTDSGINKVE